MEKSAVINKVKELIQTEHYIDEKIVPKDAERAIIMKTFGIRWDEVDMPLQAFHEDLSWDKDELKKEFTKEMDLLKLAIKKGPSYVKELKYGFQGFINGVNFFDSELAKEFSKEFFGYIYHS